MTLSATVPATAAAAATLSASLTVTTNDPTHASAAIALSATAHGGTLAWAAGSPTTADFGIAKVNQADTPIALSLTNTGNAPLGIPAGAPSGSQFTITPSSAQSLAAGANLALTAGFTPTELSPSTATSQFAVTGAICGTSVNSLSFSGQGGQGDVTGWPSAALDFGLNPCGGAAPAGQSFTLHNAGAVVAHLSTVAFSGTVGYTTDAVAGASIPANGDLTIHVSAPAIPGTSAVPGTYGDTLTITTDVAGDTSHQVLVTEGARGAVLSWDTAATANFGAFGQVPVGTTANQGFNVVNAGNAAADVTIATQGPFSATPVSFNVAADSLQTGSASFTPTTYGGASNPLSLATTSVICQPLPAALSLAGTGQQGGISLSTQSMSFSTACGATGTPATFTITNSGNLPMTWTAALLQGAGSAFTFAPATETVAPGAQSVITVTPKVLGVSPTVLTDTLTVTSDIAGDAPHPVSLSETPLGAVLSAQPLGLGFGGVPVTATGESKSLTFDVINNANAGSGPAHVNLSVADAHYTLDRPSVDVAPGAHETVLVTFAPGTTPADAVARNSTVVLSTGDVLCASAPNNVTVTGTGTLAQVSISTSELDFGNDGLVNCGATAAAGTVVLSNTGNQDYTITGADLDNLTYYTVAMSPADGIVHPGGAVTLTVTPKAIPATVATVPSMATFSGHLLLHTNAQYDDPNGHSIALVMGAKGVIIDNSLSATNWNFGSVSYGSTGSFNIGIRNHGNATAQVSLTETTPGCSGWPPIRPSWPRATGRLASAPPSRGPSRRALPPDSWTDTGTLVVVPTSGNVLCQPLGTWSSPSVNLTGLASNAPTIAVTGTLSFPSSFCDGSAPPSQSATIWNSGNAGAGYTASLDVGTYYTLSSTTGTVASNGSTVITVTPHLPRPGTPSPARDQPPTTIACESSWEATPTSFLSR